MVEIDVPKLRGKMAERGYGIASLSEELGIKRNTLAMYLKSPGKTPYDVVAHMADILCDSADEATKIFLPPTYAIRKLL